MGMYNTIKTKKPCPKCGAEVEWQSKYLTCDGYVLDNLLQKIVLNEHMDGEIHTYCDVCGTYVEITIQKGKETGSRPRKRLIDKVENL